jgi:hypothetical protein
LAENSMTQAKLRELTGDEDRGFCNSDGGPMYERVKKQLRRIGATDNCIVCGMPAWPGVLSFAHIHMRDLDLSPRKDPTRVFCLCWHHHHGCYDQGYISTSELLEAEMVWIENGQRPEPHPRDVALMQRVAAGEVPHICIWNEERVERHPTFEPGYPSDLSIGRSIAALKAHAKRWTQRADTATEEEKAAYLAKAAGYQDRAKKMQDQHRASQQRPARDHCADAAAEPAVGLTENWVMPT